MMTEELPLTATARPTSRDDVVAELFRSEYRSLVGMARLLVDGDAEEVVQESFTRLYSSFRSLDDQDRALAYLRTTVLNRSRSRLRRRRTARDRRHLLGDHGGADHAAATRLAGPDAARVRAVVRALPRRQQECIVLRYYHDASDQMIATTLDISAGSVKQHLHRASTTLARELEELS